MKHTFSKQFPHKQAKWNEDKIQLDEQHSCRVKIKTELNMMCVESYTGDKEFIIQQLLSWFRTHTIPYLISCEKKTYTPFPGTEYIIGYLLELQQLFAGTYYREKMFVRFDLEHEIIHLYHEHVDDAHKIISLSKQNFQSWKGAATKEKESIRLFQEKLQYYAQKHKTEKTKNPVVFKFWSEKEEDWRYRVVMQKSFTINKLSEKNFQKIIQFYNSFFASEHILLRLIKEIKKWDPYVCIKDQKRIGSYYHIYAFGEQFSYHMEDANWEKHITLVIEDTKYTITKPSYLERNGKEKRMCIQELLKPFKAKRLSRIMKDTIVTKHPVLLPLRLYLGYYYKAALVLTNKETIKNEVFQEIWEYIQKRSLQEGTEIQPIEERTFSTKHYHIERHKHQDWLAITKKENETT